MYFVIAANPGEALKPLSKVASGGELSRIMLAIRTVTANQDDIGTLILMKLMPESVAERHSGLQKSYARCRRNDR